MDKKVAYTIEGPNGHKMDVLHSANAWWIDKDKLHLLMAAFRLDATIPLACAHAGITVKQYKYFVSKHPEFSEIREVCQAEPLMTARRVLIRGMADPENRNRAWLAFKYLEKKLPREFGPASRRKPIADRSKQLKHSNFKEFLRKMEKELDEE